MHLKALAGRFELKQAFYVDIVPQALNITDEVART
jgi:hypothetical protein